MEEQLHAYFVKVKEIASRGRIEMDAMIEYTIDGIQDTVPNKTVLYGPRTEKEFKERLKIYDGIRVKHCHAARRFEIRLLEELVRSS